MLDALVIGGTLVDNILKFKEPHQMETCTHAVNTVTMGGVALNIARNLSAR
jgi:sugar/nucleoside kinase (ribokinase family)